MQGWPQTKSGRDVRLASRRGEDMTASAAPGVDVAGAMAALETARLGISELPAPHVQELYEVAKPDKNLAACAAAVRVWLHLFVSVCQRRGTHLMRVGHRCVCCATRPRPGPAPRP